jgi:hypothetical protein
MLHAPAQKKSSSLPAVLIALACASVAAYFVFFRGRGASSAAETPASPAVAPAAARAEAPVPLAPEPAALAPAEPRPAPAPERPPRPEAPPPAPVAFEAPARPNALSDLDALCAEGKWRDARAKLAPLFAAPEASDAERTELARRGIEINRQLLLEKTDEREVELYEIRQGDTLEGIARKFRALNGVKGALMLVNNYRENAILRAGRKIKVPRGTWTIFVDKSLFRLWVCYEGAPFKGYAITTGAEGKPTPAARYTVGTKNPKPAWWPPADMKIKGPVPYGDPQNPLGEWWIALDHDFHHGIGIHGTNDPGAIGTRASNGCVRMLNEEVSEVAALAYKGMAVTIVE